MKRAEISSKWTIENSSNLYKIDDSLDLLILVKSLQEKNINLPLLIRFPEILADRLVSIK